MAIFCKWRGPDLGDQSACPRAGLPLRLEKRAGRNLTKLSKEKCEVLQPLAMTEGWELPGWGENKPRMCLSSKGGQQHPWLYKQDHGQGM